MSDADVSPDAEPPAPPKARDYAQGYAAQLQLTTLEEWQMLEGMCLFDLRFLLGPASKCLFCILYYCLRSPQFFVSPPSLSLLAVFSLSPAAPYAPAWRHMSGGLHLRGCF